MEKLPMSPGLGPVFFVIIAWLNKFGKQSSLSAFLQILQCIFVLVSNVANHKHFCWFLKRKGQSEVFRLESSRTHRFLSSVEFYHARNFINKLFVWSHLMVKTELCESVMNEWQFLINLKGALFACCLQ